MIYCPLCKGKSYRIWKERNYKVYRCRKCTVAFLNPVPENVEKIYSEDYFQKWYIRFYNERRRYIEQLFSLIEKYIKGKGKLLDVGCGVGILLEVAKEKGWEVYGQDISNFAVDYCRNKGFFNVYNKPLPELNIPEHSFNVITMFDVIAHLKDPLSYINTCIKLLKPGGYLIIKTPYHSPLLFFIANILSFTGKSKSLLHIPAQIFHFTLQSQISMLSCNLNLLYTNRIKDFSSLYTKNILCIIKNLSMVTIWQKQTNNEKCLLIK